MRLEDIEDHGSVIMIKITNSKYPRTFTITNNPRSPIDFLGLFRKYLSLRPKNVETSRFFLQYISGKCSSFVVGVNTFGKVPGRIAAYLKIADYKLYTGHCFKRTAMLLSKSFDGALMSLHHTQKVNPSVVTVPKSASNEQKPSVSSGSSRRARNESERDCKSIEFINVEPDLIMEDAVVQYFRENN